MEIIELRLEEGSIQYLEINSGSLVIGSKQMEPGTIGNV